MSYHLLFIVLYLISSFQEDSKEILKNGEYILAHCCHLEIKMEIKLLQNILQMTTEKTFMLKHNYKICYYEK